MPPKNMRFQDGKLYYKVGPGHYRLAPRWLRLLIEHSRYGLSSFICKEESL